MKYTAILLSLIIFSLFGCSTTIVESNSNGFPGIHPALGHETPTDTTKDVDVVIVHGMCAKNIEWFNDHVYELSEQIAGSKVLTVSKKNSEIVTGKGIQVHEATILTGAGALNLYGIIYSDSTSQQKIELEKANVSGTRAWLNKKLKARGMNDCLADVTVYNGPGGKAIRTMIRDVFSQIQDKRVEENRSEGRFVLLSESLGSKVVRDVLLCDLDNENVILSKGLKLLANANVFIMYANQIPFLDLSSDKSCNIESVTNSLLSLGAGLDTLQFNGDFSDILQLLNNSDVIGALGFTKKHLRPHWVAYSDPNDILSYKLDLEKYPDYLVTNVTVKNATNWFGIFANPSRAHNGYRSNAEVKKMVLMGCDIENTTCKLKSIKETK